MANMIPTRPTATEFNRAIVDVRRFGARGDGATNDTAAFAAAEAALPASGGTIFVPPGTYIVAYRIRKAGVRLIGAGPASVLKTQDDATILQTDCPVRVLSDDCEVAHLGIDGNKTGNATLDDFTDGRQADGIGIYADRCWVHHCRIYDKIGHGIIVWNESFDDGGNADAANAARSGCVITHNEVLGTSQRAAIDIASTEGTNGLTEKINHHCLIVHNYVTAMPIVGHTLWDSLIIGNVCAGISCHTGSRRCQIVGNRISNSTGVALIYSGENGQSIDGLIEGNYIYNSNGSSISLHTLSGCMIKGNYIFGNQTTAPGIQLQGTSNDIAIEGNYVRNAGSRGIYHSAQVATRLVIRGNTVVDNGSDPAIQVVQTAGCVIEDNNIKGGTGAAGIWQADASATDLIIKNNTIRGVTFGILCWAPGATVEGNDILTASEDGIRTRSAGARIIGNKMSGVAKIGINLDTSPADVFILRNDVTSTGANSANTSGSTVIRDNIWNGTFEREP